MALNTFTPSGSTLFGAVPANTTVALPGSGSDTTVLVTNLGPGAILVALGGPTVTANSGVAVAPNASVALARGTADHIAALVVAGTNEAIVGVSSGN